MKNWQSRPEPPRDEEREALQAELTRLVGAGRLEFADFDRLSDVVWSTQDASVLRRIRAQYVSDPPAPQQSGPVPMAQPGVHHALPVENHPVASTMGEIRRTGEWTVPEHSRFKLNGSSLKLDLRRAQAAAPVCTFHIVATMSAVEIIVPPGVSVDNQMRDTFSTVSVETTQPHPDAPRVVLTGAIRGGSLKVITRQAPQTSSLWERFFGQP